MSDDSTKDRATGLLHREAFLAEVRKSQSNGFEQVRRGCLLILHFPVLKYIVAKGGEEEAITALLNLLGIIETRLRSRDTIGRIGRHSLCIHLNKCAEPDAMMIADQYAALLREVVLEFNGNRAPMDLHYRIVPLDWRGRRPRQGVSRIIKAQDDAAHLAEAIHTLGSASQVKSADVVPLVSNRPGANVATVESGKDDAMIYNARQSYRLKPGVLLKHNSIVGCYRIVPVGIVQEQTPLQQCTMLSESLVALAYTSLNGKRKIETPLVIRLTSSQLDNGSALWLKDQCRVLRVAPADVCLAFSIDSISRNLRTSLPALRALNRHGIRVMLEDISSSAQLSAFRHLAVFDCLLISAKVMLGSLTQARARKELESLIAVAVAQKREVFASGIDTPALLEHAHNLGIDVGFGRMCGKSKPLP